MKTKKCALAAFAIFTGARASVVAIATMAIVSAFMVQKAEGAIASGYFTAVMDTTVSESSPDTPRGDDLILVAGNGNYSLAKFDFSLIPAGAKIVNTVWLLTQAANGGLAFPSISRATNPWDESITFSTYGTISVSWLDFKDYVQGIVNGGSDFGVLITTSSASPAEIGLWSSEAALADPDRVAPTFFVEWETIPEPSAALLGVLGMVGCSRRRRCA